MHISKRKFVKDNLEVAEIYFQMAQNDESAANILERQKLFNQSAYFYIQAMEKYVKHHIAQKINVLNKFFSDEISKTMGHSLNKSLNLLVRIYAGNNENFFEHMNQQLKNQVLKDVDFRFLNNSLRYPIYNVNHENYTCLTLNKSDCDELKEILTALKNYLGDLKRVK